VKSHQPAGEPPPFQLENGVHLGVAIIGAGFGGICMAIRLLQAGRTDFAILEQASDLGGTWRDNTYPGCGCDLPAHLYSYSFAQNPAWSRVYARQPEILAYLRRVAADYDVAGRISYDTAVTSLEWQESVGSWQVATAEGQEAYRGVAVTGYPNLFLLVGPNSGLGHNSIVFMIEAQVRYVMQCLRWLDQGRLAAVEVRAEVQRAWNERLRQRFKRTVWQSQPGSPWQLPCMSWYANEKGRNTALWPSFSTAYWLAMRRAAIRDYEPTTAAAGRSAPPAGPPTTSTPSA
jgi:cation diffusion facilitator CzcD-associated flavoprotein CzcO